MEHRIFTKEEKEELLSNPFTQSVGDHFIKFTAEFNDLFMARHDQGVGPSTIFRDCGYRLELIGNKRVENYYNRLKNTIHYSSKRRQEFLEKTTANKDYSALPPLQAISAMQTEITYLRQEVDFLKKIIALANKKRQND